MVSLRSNVTIYEGGCKHHVSCNGHSFIHAADLVNGYAQRVHHRKVSALGGLSLDVNLTHVADPVSSSISHEPATAWRNEPRFENMAASQRVRNCLILSGAMASDMS